MQGIPKTSVIPMEVRKLVPTVCLPPLFLRLPAYPSMLHRDIPYSLLLTPMSNHDRLEQLMNEQMVKKEGWWMMPPKADKELRAAIADLKESNENLAAEVWELKSTIEFLLKNINGK